MAESLMVEVPQAGTQPDYCYPPYVSSVLRSPRQPLVVLPHAFLTCEGPVFGQGVVGARDHDLTAQSAAEPIGERIVVHGRVMDEDGKPVRHALVEVWQANAAGRYRHRSDQSEMPLDPNFSGAGRAMTDAEGRYVFRTIKPGPYPWKNHYNAWRPAHIHFSLFGAGILSRLVTQMYFPGDPLQPLDPIFNSIADEKARQRLVSRLDMERSEPDHALAYSFDIVLRGSQDTPFEGPAK
jgi:protocatechuate 3,4-dioxygenase, beta subunit